MHSVHRPELGVLLKGTISIYYKDDLLIGHTYNPVFVFLQRHGVRLNDDFDQNDAVLVSSANALHETSSSHRLFIDQVCELWDIDACRARRERGEGEALSHCCNE
jgi:hypothetical protein